MKKSSISVKLISLLLTALTLLSLLTACNGGKGGDVTTEAVTTQPEETAAPLEIIKNGEVKYQLIYPKGCESYVSVAATNLRTEFKKSTGLDINVTNDSYTEDTVENAIIVGKAKFAFSQELYLTMKYYDYRVIVDGTNIYVAAYSDTGFEKAIKYLKENVFEKKTEDGGGKQLNMKVENLVASIKDSYGVKSWKILGNELSKYRIVYADKSISDLVLGLRDEIAQKCGYVLDVTLDTNSEPTEFEILIGDTNRAESKEADTPEYLHYSACVKGSKLVIKSGGEHSLKKMFSSLLYNITKGKAEVEINADYTLDGNLYTDTLDSSKPADSNLRIMSCNILAEFESWTANAELNPYLPVSIRKEIFYAALDYYQPTVVGLQELTTNWYKAVEEYDEFDSKWAIIKPKNPNRTDGECVFSTVMYRKDLYTLVDSGMTFYSKHNNARCRCYTWAILKDNATGKEFCFVSTHWDGSGREHGFLQVAEFSEFVNEMKKRCPVFTTGDFNSNEITDEFKKFIADCDIYDAKYAALNKVNDIGSWHNFTKTDISWGSCDHITATKDTTVLKYQSLYMNEIYMCSDHCWLIADIKFN